MYDFEPPYITYEDGRRLADGREPLDDVTLAYRQGFRTPGGVSALRAGARVHPCPTCGTPDQLTEADKRHGYQCDPCAEALEGWGP